MDGGYELPARLSMGMDFALPRSQRRDLGHAAQNLEFAGRNWRCLQVLNARKLLLPCWGE